jgi:predicted membrane-bound dolichyl-phosphate-mannose-protein mannosyltransferase
MKKWVFTALTVISLLGSIGVYYGTALGPVVGSDSVGYLMGAQNLIHGLGLNLLLPNGQMHPITMHPPLYPASLALLMSLRIEPLDAARILSIVLIAATTFAVGVGLYRLTDSPSLAIISSLMIAASPQALGIHLSAMSDALSLFLTIIALLGLAQSVRRQSWTFLIVSAVFSALLILTRYTGLAILPTGFILLLGMGRGTRKNRVKFSIIYLGLVVLLVLPWMIHSYQATGMLTDRDTANLANTWTTLAKFRLHLVETTWQWIPFREILGLETYRAKLFALMAITLTFLAISMVLVRKKWKTDRETTIDSVLLPVVFLSYAFFFVLTFIAAYLLTNPTPDVNSRTLLPLLASLMLGFFSTLWFWTRIATARMAVWLQWLPGLICVLVLVYYGPETIQGISLGHAHSSWDCANPSWRVSEVVTAIRRLPGSIPIIANEEACIYFHTGRRPYDLRAMAINDPQDIPRFGDNPSDPLQVEFRDHGAALVIVWGFDNYLESRYPVDGDQVIEDLTAGLDAYPYHDGTVYFYP